MPTECDKVNIVLCSYPSIAERNIIGCPLRLTPMIPADSSHAKFTNASARIVILLPSFPPSPQSVVFSRSLPLNAALHWLSELSNVARQTLQLSCASVTSNSILLFAMRNGRISDDVPEKGCTSGNVDQGRFQMLGQSRIRARQQIPAHLTLHKSIVEILEQQSDGLERLSAVLVGIAVGGGSAVLLLATLFFFHLLGMI